MCAIVRFLPFLIAPLLVACAGSSRPVAPPTTPASPASSAPASPSDEDLIALFIDAAARQIEADARAGAARTFENISEANAYYDTLTPKAFWPRQEFFGDLFGAPSDARAAMDRIHRYMQTHPDATKRIGQVLLERVDPAMKAFIAAVERRFPEARQ